MDVILFLPTVVALLGALFLTVLTKTNHQRKMIWLMLDLAIALVYLIFAKFQGIGYTFLIDWVATTATLFIPCIAGSFFAALTGSTAADKFHKVMFWTATAISATNMALYCIMGFDTAEYYCKLVSFGEGLSASSPVIFWVKRIIGSYVYRFILIVFFAMETLIASKALKSYHSKLKEHYASVEDDFVTGDRNISVALILVCLSVLLFLSRPFSSGADIPVLYLIASPILCLAVILLVSYCYQQEMSADDLTVRTGDLLKNPVAEKESKVADGFAEEVILTKVEKCIDNRFYLNPDISLDWLARVVGTNRTYLSELIHKKYSVSFSDFVNSMRTDYAEVLLKTTTLSLDDIAVESGFRSKSSFYRNYSRFKKIKPVETRQETRQ